MTAIAKHRGMILASAGLGVGMLPFWVYYITWREVLAANMPSPFPFWRIVTVTLCPILAVGFGAGGLRKARPWRMHRVLCCLLVMDAMVGLLGVGYLAYWACKLEIDCSPVRVHRSTQLSVKERLDAARKEYAKEHDEAAP